MNSPLNIGTLALAVSAVLGLVACDRNDPRTAGQQLDATVAKTEKNLDKAQAEVRQETAEARASIGAKADQAAAAIDHATDKVAASTADAMITAAVNAELAKDPDLSALRIDVDTRDGHVSLSGTAPNATAKERATRLASGVKGVTEVENRLKLGS